jgi:hypothetical protein
MKKYFPILLILAFAAAFIVGVVQLFRLRFEAGDVYPEYSSLRSDPLGTMVFYESLARMEGLTVERDFTTENRMPDPGGTTYLHLSAPREEWDLMPEETFQEIERFLKGGGRMVITLYPDSWSSPPTSKSFRDDEINRDSKEGRKSDSNGGVGKDKKKSDPAANNKKKRRKLGEESEWKVASLRERWGVEFQLVNLKQGDTEVFEPAQVENRSGLQLSPTLAWHSGIVFSNVNGLWKTIYARGTNAVVIERHFGLGSVVMATDSYFASNEALRSDRHADFLGWLVGSNRHVVFDEAHLGVTEASGVAILMRKYRLHWLVAGLVLLAGLFIWKNSTSLAPAQPDERGTDFVIGKDAVAGFVNLLRRSISSRDLLSVCFSEWKKSVGQGRKYSAARIREAEAVFQSEHALDSRDRDPIRTYRAISKTLCSSGFRVQGSEQTHEENKHHENSSL